jgi:hypothetical protein
MRINDELQQLRREEELAEGELGMHRHLADDAERDAAVTGSPGERTEARQAQKDVSRLQGALLAARTRREKLEAKRDRLLDQMGKR